MTRLPSDDNARPMQAAAPVDGRDHQIATAAASARTKKVFGPGSKLVELYATQDCFIAFGGADVVAGVADRFIPAATTRVYAIPAGATRLAAVRSQADGTLYIGEL